jgi:hypothetical protein
MNKTELINLIIDERSPREIKMALQIGWRSHHPMLFWTLITISSGIVIAIVLIATKENIKEAVREESLTTEDVKQVFREVYAEKEPYLDKKFEAGHTAFAVSQKEKSIVIIRGKPPEDLQLDWSSAKVTSITDRKIAVCLPDIISKKTGAGIYSCGVMLERKPGFFRPTGFALANYSVAVEVIGVDQEATFVGIGFIPGT